MKGTEIGMRPVREGAPAGEDIRDQEDFLALQAEVNRGQSVSSGESAVVDWTKVRAMAESILRERSKDLLVAAYYAAAKARLEGPPGVAEGLSLMKGLVEEFWELLYPPVGRLRARRNALAWWMDRMQEILPSLGGPPLDPETKEQAVRDLRELNAMLGERDPDSPTLAPLFGLVEGLPVSLPEANSDTPERHPPPSVSTPAGTVSPAPGGFTVESEGDPLEILERIGPTLRDLADRIAEIDPGDSRAIFLSRTILWEEIRELPESEGGVTRVPAPPSHLLSALESLTASGNPEDLLRFLLVRQADAPFWFELSCRAGRLLEGRGAAGAGGGEALRGSLRALLARLPGLERLSFSGGEIPFLSEEGRSWVFPERSAQEGEGKGEERERTPSLPASVRAALADGRIGEASDRFEEIRRKEISPRGRFHLNLEFLMAVSRMGRDFPVLSLALVLLEDLERFRLDLWEPALAARALPLVCEILSENGDETHRRRAEALSGRLASFDLPGALRAFLGGR